MVVATTTGTGFLDPHACHPTLASRPRHRTDGALHGPWNRRGSPRPEPALGSHQDRLPAELLGPVVWFDPDIAIEHPDWLADGQRGPDLSDDLIWTPVVTMWQVLLDLPTAGTVPDGFGHNYAVADNTRAWAAITRPAGWTGADTQALADHLAMRNPP